MVLAHVPIAQAFELNLGIVRILDILTLAVVHDELLIDVEKLSARLLAGCDVRLLMRTLASELEPILVGKLPDSLQAGATVLARWVDRF